MTEGRKETNMTKDWDELVPPGARFTGDDIRRAVEQLQEEIPAVLAKVFEGEFTAAACDTCTSESDVTLVDGRHLCARCRGVAP